MKGLFLSCYFDVKSYNCTLSKDYVSIYVCVPTHLLCIGSIFCYYFPYIFLLWAFSPSELRAKRFAKKKSKSPAQYFAYFCMTLGTYTAVPIWLSHL